MSDLWALRMTWTDLAFLHWPVPVASLSPLVPGELEIEEFDGSAWVGIVPFEMRDVRIRGLPGVPTATDFPELNVRTYVRHRGRDGIYFFSLDAASLVAVLAARTFTGLRYWHANMRIDRTTKGIWYESRRVMETADGRAELIGAYRPVGDVFTSEPGTFEYWSTERYTLFSRWAGKPMRIDIEHERWPLQKATAEIERNSMASAAGIALPDRKPHVMFATRIDVRAFLPQRVHAPRPSRPFEI
jgi:uncharacterized protein YqjF (DUF2071 family)